MPEVFWLICAALSAFLGMCWLALAMPVHWQQLDGNRKNTTTGSQPHRLKLRVCGSAMLLISGFSCLQADHPSMAVLVWVMFLTSAAFGVAMLLGNQPTLLRLVCPSVFASRSISTNK